MSNFSAGRSPKTRGWPCSSLSTRLPLHSPFVRGGKRGPGRREGQSQFFPLRPILLPSLLLQNPSLMPLFMHFERPLAHVRRIPFPSSIPPSRVRNSLSLFSAAFAIGLSRSAGAFFFPSDAVRMTERPGEDLAAGCQVKLMGPDSLN